MKLQNVLTFQGIFQPVSLPRSSFFSLFWLLAADIRWTRDSVSSTAKTGYKARYKAKVSHLKVTSGTLADMNSSQIGKALSEKL